MAATTHGRWQAKNGHADDFIKAWQDFADWSMKEIEGCEWAKLYQDRDNPNAFSSIGEWTDDDAVARWRGLDGFQDHMQAVNGHLEDFTIYNVAVVGSIG